MSEPIHCQNCGALAGVTEAQPERARAEIKEYAPGELPWGNQYLVYLVRGEQRRFVGGTATLNKANQEAAKALSLERAYFDEPEDKEVRTYCLWDAC